MVDVFVSRPIELPSEFEEGLRGFLGLLADRGLNARTLGVSDFSVENPLDAVIKLMDQCSGAAISGYPQIPEIDGVDPDNIIRLPSAWNQIEATLAHVNKLPKMIVTHPGIDRGIFDRGTSNSFVFTEDLSKAAWSLQPQILGALKSWKELISAMPTRPTRPDLESSSAEPINASFSAEQLETLKLIGEFDNCTAGDVAVQLDISDQKAPFFIDEWMGLKAIGGAYAIGSDTVYKLTPAGRKILNDEGLLD